MATARGWPQCCGRGGSLLNGASRMSWFTTQIICLECGAKESELLAALPHNDAGYEGCGYLPLLLASPEAAPETLPPGGKT